MNQVLVRYKVKADRVAENEELVRAVYEELERKAPGQFRYATFRLDDGQTFVHLASKESDDGHEPLPELEAFRRFLENIDERTEERPVVSELTQIGSYRLVGPGGVR